MHAYLLPGVAAGQALESPQIAAIKCGGPWVASATPHGALLTLADYPRSLDAYASPVDIDGGIQWLAPLVQESLYDVARPDVTAGVEVRLACGLLISIPVATIQHRQLLLSGKPRIGPPVTEYGRLAASLYDLVSGPAGLDKDTPEVARFLVLALAQHYKVTAELIDHLGIISVDDVDSILGAAWTGDPKALAPASEGDAKPSITLASLGA